METLEIITIIIILIAINGTVIDTVIGSVTVPLQNQYPISFR